MTSYDAGVMELQKRVDRMEREISEMNVKITGAVTTLDNMRAVQDGITPKIDTLITAVAEMRARPAPPDMLAVAAAGFNMVAKGVVIFSAVVGGILYLIRTTPHEPEARPSLSSTSAQSPGGYVEINGKRYRITQPQ